MTALSNEQELAMNLFKDGQNLFITGPGGTGKSYMIKKMVDYAEEMKKNIQVTAMTGCASILLECNAKTIHSWSGLGVANGTIYNNIDKVVKNKYKRKKWNKVDILIIDEVSMMSDTFLEMLDGIGRKIKKEEKPFGGIQVIFSGDFYQLPPISKEGEELKYCFESEMWNTIFHSTIELKKIFRQTDLNYIKMLNQIRVGKLSKKSYELLKSRLNIPLPKDFEPPILHSSRNQVIHINKMKIKKLEGEEKTFSMKTIDETKTGYNELDLYALKNNTLAEEKFITKKGAQVMCILNMESYGQPNIVNGSRGIIKDFTKEGYPIIEFYSGIQYTMKPHQWKSDIAEGLSIEQIPLIHAWAITIHKSQGLSIEHARMNIGSNIFECGQTYVALSRVKNIQGLFIDELDISKIKINKKVQNFYNQIINSPVLDNN